MSESLSLSTEHCVDELHTSVILGMGINSDEEPQETDFVTRWLTTFPTNSSAQMECALMERVNWDDILRTNYENRSPRGLGFSDDSSPSHVEDQLVMYSANYNSNVNAMFRQTAKEARYLNVVPHWQDHSDGELCHSRAMSDLGSLAFEMEYASWDQYGSPPSGEDAFNQNKLVLPTNSAQVQAVPYSTSLSFRRQNVDGLKLDPQARFERATVNVEDDAISKLPRSESLHSESFSREEKFKEQRKETMKRKAVRGTESPSAPPCKRFYSPSETIVCQRNESEENFPASNNKNGGHRSKRGAATDPQSVYARNRRERINERLKVLQKLVPNGEKVDISTMLEEAISYVKFLQLQVKFLSSDEYWMYTPIAYNGFDFAFNIPNGA